MAKKIVSPISEEILSERELKKIARFTEDTVLFEAVKKYVLAVAYRHGTMEADKPHKGNLNYALNMAWGAINSQNGMPRSDEELGQNLRALAQAVSLVESGFAEMSEVKEVEDLPEEETTNPAE